MVGVTSYQLAKELFSFSPTKDIDWYKKMVYLFDASANKVVSSTTYKENRDVIFGNFDISMLKNFFSGDEMERIKKKLSNSRSHIFERIRNTIIDQRSDAQLSIALNSLDPSIERVKDKDKELLRNRAGIEAILKNITANSGLPAINVDKDNYEGNVEDFDRMGLNEYDPDDLDMFFEIYYQLLYIIDCQNGVNSVFSENQISRIFDMYINDILICLQNWSRVYVDELDGGIKTERIPAYNVSVVGSSEKNDFSDVDGIKIERTTTIRNFMSSFGASFDFEENWTQLLFAMGIRDMDGIIVNGTTYAKENFSPEKCIDLAGRSETSINYCYMEFLQYGVTNDGAETGETPLTADKVKYGQTLHYAYYFNNYAGMFPGLIKYGKVYMQSFAGQNDQYSGFTIKGNKRSGIPVAEIIKIYKEIWHRAFVGFEMLVNEVKPDGYKFLYETLVKTAEYLNKAKNVPTDLKQSLNEVIEMNTRSPNVFTAIPRTPEGDILGGGPMGMEKNENGLNKTAGDLLKIMQWAENSMIEQIGALGIEIAEPKQGWRLSIENKKRTRAATSFIDFILLSHLEDIAKQVTNYLIDITKFKNIPAYKYYEHILGTEAMERIRKYDKALHRTGIYIQSFNLDIEREEVKQLAFADLANRVIDLKVYQLVKNIDNPQSAIKILAREEQKAKKLEEQKAQTQHDRALELEAAKRQTELERQNTIGMWNYRVKQAEVEGFMGSSRTNADAGIRKEEIKQQGQDGREQEKNFGKIQSIQAEKNAKEQEPI